ncbi:MAG: hypothetical protein M3083_19820 [Actinomycetota bacterium]|nr:hypothetical protein [Actinomycetota bacterium]
MWNANSRGGHWPSCPEVASPDPAARQPIQASAPGAHPGGTGALRPPASMITRTAT